MWQDTGKVLFTPWLDSSRYKNALHDNRKSNKESYEVVRQRIEFAKITK